MGVREPGLWKAADPRLPFKKHRSGVTHSSWGALRVGEQHPQLPLSLQPRSCSAFQVPPKAKLPSCQVLYVHLKNIHKPQMPHLCVTAEHNSVIPLPKHAR